MKQLIWLCSATFLLLAGCGGGGGSAPAGGLALTQTTGNVTSLFGESGDVQGVRIQVPIVGEDTTTGTDGRFDLGDLPAAVLQVVVTAPAPGTVSNLQVDLSGGGSAALRLTIDEDGVSRMSVEHCDGDDSKNETSAPLTAIEPGLEGEVEIEAENDGDMAFEVEVEDLAVGRVIEVFVTDAGGVTESQGQATADAEGEAELELETEHGDSLPFGVTDVADLEGFTVTVRDVDTGDDIMTGVIPALGAVPEPCVDGDDDHDGSHLEGESHLINADGVAGEAEVEIESEPGEEEFEVEVEDTDVVGTIEVWLEDPAAPGTLVKIGVLTPDDDGDENELEFELSTEHGDALPFDVAGVVDLVGLEIELRAAADGAVLYSGVVPPLNAS